MTAVPPTVPAVLTRAELGEPGEALAGESGESVGIHRLTGPLAGSGLLFKQYKRTAAQNGRDAALEQLIAFGRSPAAVGRTERELLLGCTSWPVAKVTDRNGELVGCLIPEADRRFRAENGRLREIDTLAQSDERLAAKGVPVTAAQRAAVCRAVVRVAAALERRRLVYSDWNYANALWCPADCSVFVIDIDGCRPERMPNIFQSDWEDPLTDGAMPADVFTDRYRVALLTARCLTGRRDLPSVLHALDGARDDAVPGRSLLLDMLWAAARETRPASRSLLAALDGADVHFPVERLPLPEPRTKPPRRTAPKVLTTDLTVLPDDAPAEAPEDPTDNDPPASPATTDDVTATAWAVGIVVAVLVAVVIVLLARNG
ncbi:hypothetical protein ACFVXG_45900 [Kitasatospora sp. NPDC058162]|uniref:hypothetical protein n=1 Tax=Kitasatospora sp. NPDC058162 TaxID=3346362 RepID=UPI0036DF1A61